MSNKILSEVIKSAPSKIIDLFIADATSIGGPLLRFFSDTNELGDSIYFDGDEYNALPCEITGIEWSANGELPTPKFTVANIDGVVTILNLQYQDLLGTKITRIRTLIKFLDSVNFISGNLEADPSAHFPIDVYYIDRKVSQNAIQVEFELVSALDISSIKIPRRTILQNLCPWRYKDPDTCGWTYPLSSPLYYKSNGDQTMLLAEDQCGKRLSDCKLRFNQTAEKILSYGGFPGAGLYK